MRPSWVAAAIAGALVFAGCGSSDSPDTPTACLAPASAYVEALRSAPNDVRLAGGTPISDCLVDEQAAGQLETVGKSMVDAANELNREALRTRDPDGFVQLGYLAGAVERGADETGGIHRDLVLRVESAAGYTGAGAPRLPASLRQAFAYGRGAGLDQG